MCMLNGVKQASQPEPPEAAARRAWEKAVREGDRAAMARAADSLARATADGERRAGVPRSASR